MHKNLMLSNSEDKKQVAPLVLEQKRGTCCFPQRVCGVSAGTYHVSGRASALLFCKPFLRKPGFQSSVHKCAAFVPMTFYVKTWYIRQIQEGLLLGRRGSPGSPHPLRQLHAAALKTTGRIPVPFLLACKISKSCEIITHFGHHAAWDPLAVTKQRDSE